jgi:hypothetical protein
MVALRNVRSPSGVARSRFDANERIKHDQDAPEPPGERVRRMRSIDGKLRAVFGRSGMPESRRNV